MPRVDTSQDCFVILKTERPDIFCDEGSMDCYLGGMFRVGEQSGWDDDRYELEFVGSNYIVPIDSHYELKDWVFDNDCIDTYKTNFLQLLLKDSVPPSIFEVVVEELL